VARPQTVTREQILSAARVCFLEHGPNCSTEVIAQRLGVSPPALFRRIGTKRDMLIEALGPPTRVPWADHLEQGPDERPLREQLTEIVADLTEYFAEVSPRLAALRASGISLEEVFAERYKVPPPIQGHQAVATWIRKGQRAGRIRACDPKATAVTLFGALQARPLMHHTVQSRLRVAQDTYNKNLVEMLHRALAPLEK
jgi:AcrR family transcriptional regulator